MAGRLVRQFYVRHFQRLPEGNGSKNCRLIIFVAMMESITRTRQCLRMFSATATDICRAVKSRN